ncbi:MAG TPA: hypothetical protein VGB77_04850 [Abditibacteriaceae bacterium]|jgi:hypothetical protein
MNWNWKDDYALELAGKDNSELLALDATYSNLNSNVASERLLEQALMIRTELASRNANAGRLLEGVNF